MNNSYKCRLKRNQTISRWKYTVSKSAVVTIIDVVIATCMVLVDLVSLAYFIPEVNMLSLFHHFLYRELSMATYF